MKPMKNYMIDKSLMSSLSLGRNLGATFSCFRNIHSSVRGGVIGSDPIVSSLTILSVSCFASSLLLFYPLHLIYSITDTLCFLRVYDFEIFRMRIMLHKCFYN